ncbi:oxidoreductase, short chain dehydrogenase/reductase family [Verrucomicrobiia bacterium DG1235]|nr:oxidoreductase, short chain dehydrogenase/reductase family [Verrucomicrobiae bacterium DG1235]
MDNLGIQVAVITGAAGGIGEALALDLTKRGIKGLALVDFNERVADVAKACNDFVGKAIAHAFIGDTSDEQFRQSVFETMEQSVGTPTIVVPAAGITRDGLAVRIDKESGEVVLYPVDKFRQTVEINMIAPVYWAMQMIGGIAAKRKKEGLKRWNPEEGIQGAIVFIGSIASSGNVGQVSYSSTKAGLEGAASTLMAESMYYGVRCSVIHPGFTDTPMVRALGDDYINSKVLPQTQLKRLIKPEEIADAICFMLTNSAVSGELWADAGWRPSA